MKSELKETKLKPTPLFPALYKSVRHGSVILFSDPTSGVVVKQSEHLALGEFSDYYIDCTNTEYWQRLPSGSQVILTQD